MLISSPFCWICILSFKKKRTPLKTTHVFTLFLLLLVFHIQSYNHPALSIFFWLKIIQLNNKKTEQKYGIQPLVCFSENIPIASHCKYPKDLTKHSSQRVPSYEPWRKLDEWKDLRQPQPGDVSGIAFPPPPQKTTTRELVRCDMFASYSWKRNWSSICFWNKDRNTIETPGVKMTND